MDNLKNSVNERLLEEKIGAIEKEIEQEPNLLVHLKSVGEIARKEFPQVSYLADKLFPNEAIIAISGLPAAYKTWFAMSLAAAVAEGKDFLGKFPTAKTGVLYIDEETGERWLKPRILNLKTDLGLPIYFLSKTGFKVTSELIDDLIALCKDKNIGLVIFDSLVRINTAKDENDAIGMASVFGLLQKLVNAGITVIFTHHHRKSGPFRQSNPSQDMRGSSDILAVVDCHVALERDEDHLKVTQTKLRQGQELRPFDLKVVSNEQEFRFEYLGEIDEEKNTREAIKTAITDFLEQEPKPVFKKELFEALKNAEISGGYSTFSTVVKEMVADGKLFEAKGEKNKTFLWLKPIESGEDQPEEEKVVTQSLL